MRPICRLRLVGPLIVLTVLATSCGTTDHARLVVKMRIPASSQSGRWVVSVEASATAHGTTTGKVRDLPLRERQLFDLFTFRGGAHYYLGVLAHRPGNKYVILGSCAKALELPRNNRRTALVDFGRNGNCTIHVRNG